MKPHKEFEQLVHQYINEQITESDLLRLNEQLSDNPQARKIFNELLNLDSALAAVAVEEIVSDQPVVLPSEKSRFQNSKPSARWIISIAASFIFLISSVWWWQTTQQVFATVSSTAGVEGYPEGTELRSQLVVIEQGSLELISKRGAKIVIEAPAKFWFESAQRLHITRGRMAADVPPSAKGFTVVTPTGEAIDLGTKFGVDVPLEGHSEIHVFQGEVIAQSASGKNQQSLRDGDAIQLQRGIGIARTLRSSAFIQPGEVSSLRAALANGQNARSDANIMKLRNDPKLILFLDFESKSLPQGTYRMTQGRWPGSHAPEFVNLGDHIKIDVGNNEPCPQLTLAAWVRLDHLGEPFQSLLHTDGWSQQNGQVHWMVTHHSTMRLALFGNKLAPDSTNADTYPDSLTPVLPQQGRWVHLAVVYDSVAGTVNFYFNGKFDKQEQQQVAFPAQLGPSQIGNWDLHDRKLSGRMDELLILGRAMSHEEINLLFESGTPYR